MTAKPPHDWMWAEACEMLDRAERLHRQFFKPGPAPNRGPTWEPPIDVIETEDSVAVVVALPGVEAAAIEVAIEGDVLIVRGVRRLPAVYRQAALHRLEVPHGQFERRIRLMWDHLKLVRRDLVDGCLSLVFQKLV